MTHTRSAAMVLVLAGCLTQTMPVPNSTRSMTVEDDLRACVTPAVGDSTLEQKGAAAAEVDCLKAKLSQRATELRAANAPRAQTLGLEDASFQRFMASHCALDEDLQWLDLQAGTRGDGSLRTTTFMACQRAHLVSRLDVTHARLRHDDARLVAWLAEGPSAQRALNTLASVRKAATGFSSQAPVVGDGAAPVDWRAQLQQLDALEAELKQLVALTCADPAFTSTPDCATKLSAKLLTNAAFASSGP